MAAEDEPIVLEKGEAQWIAAKHNIYKFYQMTVMMLLSFHAKKRNKAQGGSSW